MAPLPKQVDASNQGTLSDVQRTRLRPLVVGRRIKHEGAPPLAILAKGRVLFRWSVKGSETNKEWLRI